MKIAEKEKFVDVTSEWLANATPNSSEVVEQLYYEHEGVKYVVDGKNVILDYSEKEREVAEWLKNTLGGEILMLPKINCPKSIKTADYIFRGERWDLKAINGISDRTIDDAVKNNKKQSDNFILDISKCRLSIEKVIFLINKLYKSPQRKWVNKIIIIKNQQLIKIFQRIKEVDPSP